MPGLHPAHRDWSSNRLDATDATPERADLLAERFYASLHDRAGHRPVGRVTMIEKTPKNSLRVPFLARVFPDARFLFLHRDPREVLASMMEAWETGRFVTYPRLPGWGAPAWSLLLVPGWRDLISAPLEQIVALQWTETVATLLDDLEALSASRVHAVSYDRFLAKPTATAHAVADAFGLTWDRALGDTLPLSPTVVTPPREGKWRAREAAIGRVWGEVEPVAERARRFLAERAVG